MSTAWLVAGALLVAACGDDAAREPPPDATREPSADSAPPPATVEERAVRVYFTRDEAPVAVTRRIPAGIPPLEGALEALLEGPTAAERASGISSWFSDATAGLPIHVGVDETGRAVVDFPSELSRVIPGASSSAGGAALLGELNATVFQFSEVRSVEYRLDGSCEAFWNWLQYACQVVPRPPERASPRT